MRIKNFNINVASTIVWGVAISLSIAVICYYDSLHGLMNPSPVSWPPSSGISRSREFQLVLFIHPHCPCSRATIEELSVIQRYALTKIHVDVLFLHPVGFSKDWVMSALWKKAAAIPHVQVLEDYQGVEAVKFGALTSGHALLFDPEGLLLFSGGITNSRGHIGASAGQRAILAYTSKQKSEAPLPVSAPVYGCPLFNEIDIRENCGNAGS